MPKKAAKKAAGKKSAQKRAPKKAAVKKSAKKVIIKKTAEDETPAIPLPRLSKGTPRLLRGFKDILPEDQKYWQYIRDKARNMAEHYSFDRVDLPLLEDTNLFVRTVGKETDIVNKEMFSFMDRSDQHVSLRPEATAQVARAYINHGLLSLPQPVKMWYIGPMFRYERPQSGRHRQFHQFGYEVIGDSHPVIDAQLVIMAYNFFRELGIETTIEINSIGTPQSRREYIKELLSYYKTQKSDLCETCVQRLSANPLRLLDCKEEKCVIIREDAPHILDWLDDESKNHFTRVLEYLDDMDIVYNLNPYLVRGLDYYTKTVFEIWPAQDEIKSQSALGAGGRYDGLIETLGGKATPAVGFAVGIERAVARLKETQTSVPETRTPDVFVAQLGDASKKACLKLFEDLRREGVDVAESFSKDDLKTQLATASKLNVRYTLILGQKEMGEGTILLRDMEGGMQETINFKKIVREVKKRLTI